jgi:hypothetical protein
MCEENYDIVPDITQNNWGEPKFEGNPFEGLEFDSSTLAAQVTACVTANYNNGKICVNFAGLKNLCFNVPLKIPAGATVKVCMSTCGFRFKVPPFKGIKATVYFNNQAVWTGIIWGNC